VPFSFQIVGFRGTAAVVVRCFEDKEDDELKSEMFKVSQIKFLKKKKEKKKGHTSVRGKSLDIQHNTIFTLPRLRELVMTNDNLCVLRKTPEFLQES
jgi:hypothetical protein